jgi:hypothetical protein
VASAPTLHSRNPLKLRRPKPVRPAAPSGVPFRRTRFRSGRESLESLQMKSPVAHQGEQTEATAHDGTEPPAKDAGIVLPPLKVPPLAIADERASKAPPSRSPVSFQTRTRAHTHRNALTTARTRFVLACVTRTGRAKEAPTANTKAFIQAS